MTVVDVTASQAPRWSNPTSRGTHIASWSRRISMVVEGVELTIDLRWSDWDGYEVELWTTADGDEESAFDFVHSLTQDDLYELDLATREKS